MRKLASVILSAAMACMLLAGCGAKSNNYEIALITDKGNINDKSFNQGSWEGVLQFTKEKKVSHKYFKPEEYNDAGYLASIDEAVAAGAKVVVTPGFYFEVPVYEAQTKYPDVKFILIDGEPHSAGSEDVPAVYDTKSNVACIKYAEEQSGYLAGYAAVKDGLTKLGFMGGIALPAVQAFGYGYLQGAETAAKELNLADGSVSCIYHYTGNFDETDTNKATAKTMYQEGAEVIFACGGSVGKSVMSAAQEAGAKVIGVDVDQRYDSETVITSATKGLTASVKAVLEAIYKTDSWDTYAGKLTYFNASTNGVGLPTSVIGDDKANAFDRFATFDKAAYDAVFDTLAKGSVVPVRTITIKDTTGGIATAEELSAGLGLTKVKVETR